MAPAETRRIVALEEGVTSLRTQQAEVLRMVTTLITKLDTLYGTDAGKVGQVDKLREQMENNKADVRHEMEQMESRLVTKIEHVRAEVQKDTHELTKKVENLTKLVTELSTTKKITIALVTVGIPAGVALFVKMIDWFAATHPHFWGN